MDLLTGSGVLAREMVRRRLFHDTPITVVDVGCSGGIGEAWRCFEPDLRGVGVDPVIDECARLQAAEANRQVRYEPCCVGLPEGHPFLQKRAGRGPVGNNPWDRTSSSWAVSLLQPVTAPTAEISTLNDWNVRRLSDVKLTMKELCDKHQLDTVDFIKIDVDGYDMDVLMSAADVLDSLQVLALGAEVNFFGSDCETDHTFHNTDRFMRSKGFSLFGLSVRPYSHRALPAPFHYGIPGKTHSGPPLQGDALYVRDLADPALAEMAASYSDSKILKLAALCELAHLPDCAAEVLNRFESRLERITDLESLRDILVPQACPGTTLRYREYLGFFQNSIGAFLAMNTTASQPKPEPAHGLLARTLGYVRRGVKKACRI